MNIGFDLDKVFIDYPPLVPSSFIDRLYKKKSKGTPLYRFPSKPEQILRKLSHAPFLRPVIKENLIFLNRISQKNHRLFLISSRFGFLQKETDMLMKRLGFDTIFEHLYFNFSNKQPHEFKNEILKKHKLDMYVDDDFPLIKFVAKQNKTTRFFWLTNVDKKQLLTRNITAIKHLSDILS